MKSGFSFVGSTNYVDSHSYIKLHGAFSFLGNGTIHDAISRAHELFD